MRLILLLSFLCPLIAGAALPNLTYTTHLDSETTNVEGKQVFTVSYTIINNTGFHVKYAELVVSSSLTNSLTELADLDTPDRFRYYGIPNTITATGQTHTILCHVNDANTVRDAINNGTLFNAGPSDHLDAFLYTPLDLSATLTSPTETLEPSGRILLSYTVTVVNSDTSKFKDIQVKIDGSALAAYDITYPVSYLLPYIDSSQTLNPAATFNLSVLAAEKTDVLNAIQAGSLTSVTAWEINDQAHPDMPLDQETQLAYSNPIPVDTGRYTDPATLVFSSATPFLNRVQVGHHLINSSDYPLTILTTPNSLVDSGILQLHFIISGKQTVGVEVHLTGHFETTTNKSGHIKYVHREGAISIPGAFRAADSLLFKSPYATPAYETNYPPATAADLSGYLQKKAGPAEDESKVTDTTMGDYLSTLNAKPVVIDNLEVVPGVFVNGQIFIKALDIDFDMAWRDDKAHQLTVTYTSSIFLNLVIETRGGADNRAEPDLSKVLEIVDLGFIPLAIPVSGTHTLTIYPRIKFEIGTEVFLPGKSTIPLQTGLTVGGKLTYHKGTFSTEGIKEVETPLISKAEVQEALQAEVTAWVGAELGLSFAISSIDAGLFPLLSGGLTFKAKMGADFLLNPLGTPWWSLDGTLTLTGAANLESFYVPLIDIEKPLGSPIPLFNIAASGPLLLPVGDNLVPELGGELRWATVIETGQATTSREPLIKSLPNNQSYVLSPAAGSNSATLSKLDKYGNLLWHRGLRTGVPASFALFPDGSTLIVSGASSRHIILTKIDPSGNLLWNTAEEFDVPGSFLLKLTDIISAQEAGQTVFYICGEESFSHDPILIKADANGSLIFKKKYPLVENAIFNALTLASNGDILLAGETHYVPPGQSWATSNGLLSRIAPDGSLLWSRMIYTASTSRHYDLAEDPATGDIYTVGQYFGTVSSPHSGIQVCKWTSDGDLHKRIILEPEIDGLTVDVYSAAFTCFFEKNSLFLAGRTAIGSNYNIFVARLSTKLGTLFFTSINSPYNEGPSSIAPVADGFLLAMTAATVRPWGTSGSTNPNLPGSGAHALVSLQPWEGFLRFHELTQLEPHFHKAYSFGTFDVQDFQITNASDAPNLIHIPGLLSTLKQDQFNITVSHPDAANVYISAQEVFENIFQPTENLSTIPSTKLLIVVPFTPQTRNARDLPDTAITSYDRWETWHALTGGEAGENADPDGDGKTNILEAFTGTNPRIDEPNPTPILAIQGDELHLHISPNANFLNSEIQTSFDLLPPWSFYSTPITPTAQSISVIPINHDQPRQFFRLKVSNP